MFLTLMTMLLAAEASAEAAQETAQAEASKTEAEKTTEEKAEDDALKHLEDAMKKKSGEDEDGEGGGGDDDSAKDKPAEQPESEQEKQKPEAKEDEEAKKNPAEETKPTEQKAEQPKPEAKKPDEADPLQGLETSLENYFDKSKDFGDEAMDGFMEGVKALVAEVKAMRSVQAELKTYLDEQNAQQVEAAIDEGFDALSDDLADVFGRGAGRKIERAFLDNREKALQKVAVLKAGYEATGQDYDLKGLIREAAMMLAPELVKNIPKTRKREFITPPQKPESQNLSGDDAAFAEFQRRFKDLQKE